MASNNPGFEAKAADIIELYLNSRTEARIGVKSLQAQTRLAIEV